ncbi:AbiH family protein [Faecalibacter rhinopitheci]|uniref:Bacteriophage abortive infection AbiH n=1 Tax=Faecalibacter rhinopitheci TaxID=2779678 RepID=A0A8J7FQI9_9FLAO|nr:AbiH family protein [Faecalibacter rhinopitheci]MBF0596428.1 hypothetical protein [Faecalibacter rhinopitheci]
MNRIILIGNGFDLAHGLKTSYNDFIKWYLKRALLESVEFSTYEDDLISVKSTNYHRAFQHFKTIDNYIDLLYNTNLSNCENETINTEYHGVINPFEVKIKSKFLRILLGKCSINTWVEVENDYYEILKEVFNLKKDRDIELKNLNNSLSEITRYLELYLTELQPTHLNSEFLSIFDTQLDQDDFVQALDNPGITPKDTLILNFNYTSTVEEYFKDSTHNINPKKYKVNYINGQLNNIHNPIIFGFGDELDEVYNLMELEKNKAFLKFIKSFWYFKTNNYHNLLRFINSDEYQIFILGHSCGLSDRTMLNMLFENENCKSIKLFYYDNGTGYDNYEDLTYEISQHIRNKAKMRQLIVPKSKSISIPQVNTVLVEN